MSHLPFCFGFTYYMLSYRKREVTIEDTVQMFDVPFARVSDLLPRVYPMLPTFLRLFRNFWVCSRYIQPT
jgi:hypothetical protein